MTVLFKLLKTNDTVKNIIIHFLYDSVKQPSFF